MKRTPLDLDINEWQDYIGKFRARWPLTVNVAMRIENTPLTSARYAGGMIYNGAHYTYFEPRDPSEPANPDGTPYVAWLMVRDDFLRFVSAELNKEAKRSAEEQKRAERQPELWEDNHD